MKHSGKAFKAALKLVIWSLLLLIGIYAIGIIARYLSEFIAWAWPFLFALWFIFAAFVFYFFRDPTPNVPADKDVIISPAHGKIDVIEETDEPEFLQGKCRRVSMFLSPLDVHVQYAPVAGKIAIVRHTPGKYLAAMRTDCSRYNENVFIGLESAEKPGEKIALRLVAGVLARRIIPWVKDGDTVARGERISIIQFGSRCDIYLPLNWQVAVKVGDKAVGGTTIIARRS